jgi:hypothetical protein
VILLFAPGSDPTTRRIAEHLIDLGATFAVLDPSDLHRRWRAKSEFSSAGARLVIECADRTIAGEEIGAVLWRRPGASPAPELADPRMTAYLVAEAREHLRALCLLIDAFWLPARPSHIVEMQHKPPQLALARRLGFDIPPTLIPSSGDDVLAFWEAHGGRIVCKPLGPTAFHDSYGADLARYTEPITPRQLAHADGVARCPVILQAYVEKRAELRVTVVGDRVLAAEIASQESNHTRLDWRRYDHHATRYRAVELPTPLRERCIALVAEMQLSYAAIDLIVTRDDHHVFLEVNPAGECEFVEQRSGLPITLTIAELLAQRDRTRKDDRTCVPRFAMASSN